MSGSFINQSAYYNNNMALLNQMQEDIDFLNLNGGIRHMPPLDWITNADRVNAQGKKLAVGLSDTTVAELKLEERLFKSKVLIVQ